MNQRDEKTIAENLWSDDKVRKIYVLFPEGKRKAFTLSYDDGYTCDVRLVEMMRKYGVKGTFNINSGRWAETSEMEKKPWGQLTKSECLELYGDDMEVAIHGVSHPYWNNRPTAQAMLDILEDRRQLEQAYHRIIRGAAYPYGITSDDVVEILRLADIQYCRLGSSTGKLLMKRTIDWLRFEGTCRHRDPRLMEYAEKFLKPNTSGIRSLFYVFGHSYEFVEDNNWELMETLLQTVSGKEDVWYATNIEIVEYCKAGDRLIFNLDDTVCRNPTDIDIWLQVGPDKTVVKVPAGKTITLP